MRFVYWIALCLMVVLLGSISTVAGTEGGHDHGDAEATEAESKATEVEGKAEEAKEKTMANPVVVFETNQGDIKIELFRKEAPLSTANFLSYVRDGFYHQTIFHRVIPNFVIQAGGWTGDLGRKKQKEPIKNEATNGLKNERGTLSMARTSDINSGTSHFFINLKHNTNLDHKGMEPANYGYAVFGKVVDGMKVVDKIAGVKTTTKNVSGTPTKDMPVSNVMINKAYVMGEAEEAKKTEKAAEKTAEEETEQQKKKVEAKTMKEDQ